MTDPKLPKHMLPNADATIIKPFVEVCECGCEISVTVVRSGSVSPDGTLVIDDHVTGDRRVYPPQDQN